jgi:PleD family two-component response regulator
MSLARGAIAIAGRGSGIMFALAEDEVLSRTRGLEAELAEARSKIKQLESRIETDALLDIFNRRGFERELTRAVLQVNRYQRTAAVVFIDLDDFKSINDRFGHLPAMQL